MNKWHTDRERREVEQDWPPHVWGIGLDRLDYLGVDSEGHLYWDGKRVEVQNSVRLTRWQRVGAVAVTLSAVISALAATATALADWSK